MDLKFFLNKFAKVDNIEGYTLKSILALKDRYEDYIESSDGQDPDFPLVNFGNNGKKVNGSNAALREEIGEEPADDGLLNY